jgi:hypothetical protein
MNDAAPLIVTASVMLAALIALYRGSVPTPSVHWPVVVVFITWEMFYRGP